MEVPRVIDFERFPLNLDGREGGHKENNGQREILPNNEGQGGGGGRRTVNNQGQGGGGCGGGGCGGGGCGGGCRRGEGCGGGGSVGGWHEGAAQGQAAATINQGRGGGGRGGGGHGGTPQIHAEEGVMVGIPKALVHRWRQHSYRRLTAL